MQDRLIEKILAELSASPLGGSRPGFWLTSRIHPLRGWPGSVWLKRDDELSCSISGSKWRKLVSLSAAWQRHKADCLVAWGSGRSQHLLALMQLSREQGLELHLFSKENSPARPIGPDQLWPLLLDQERHHIIPRGLWSEAPERAAELSHQLQTAGRRVFLVHEGGAQAEALLGAMSLALDIVQQEKILGFEFSHVAVDAGTGLTAQALILGLALLGRYPHCEVVLCAGSSAEFAAGLLQRQQELADRDGLVIREPLRYASHRPPTARSFGSSNAAVFEEIRRTAQDSGVLLDPIYSAKLFLTMREKVLSYDHEARVLLIHSGGVLSLFGFPLHTGPSFA